MQVLKDADEFATTELTWITNFLMEKFNMTAPEAKRLIQKILIKNF